MHIDTPARQTLLAGLAWGLLAAVIWSAYSVLARLAVKAGLSPTDLTLLRFLPGGLLLWPWLWRRGGRTLGGLGWRRGLGACRTWESPAANRPQRRLFHRLLAP